MSFLKTFSKRADEPFRPDPIVEDEVVEEVPAAPGTGGGSGTASPSLGLGDIKAEPLPEVEIPEVTVELGTAELAKNLEALDVRKLATDVAEQGALEPIKALREVNRLKYESGASTSDVDKATVEAYLKDQDISKSTLRTPDRGEVPVLEVFAAPVLDLPAAQMQRLKDEGRQIKKVRTFEDVTVDVVSQALKDQYIKNAVDKQAGAAKYRADLQALADSGALGRYEDGSPLKLRDVERALTREYGRRMAKPGAASGVNLLLSLAETSGAETLNLVESTFLSRLAAFTPFVQTDEEFDAKRALEPFASGRKLIAEDTAERAVRLEKEVAEVIPMNIVADAVERGTIGTRPSFSDLKSVERPQAKAFAALPAEDQSLVGYANAMGVNADVLAGVSRAESANTPTALAFNLDEAREFMTPDQIAVLDRNLSERYGYVRPSANADEPVYAGDTSTPFTVAQIIDEVRAVSPQAAARATAFGQFQVLGETGNILGLAREAAASQTDRELTDDEAAEVAFQMFKEQPRAVSFALADRWWSARPTLKAEVNRGDFSNLLVSYTGGNKTDRRGAVDADGNPAPNGIPDWMDNFNKGASRLVEQMVPTRAPQEAALVSTGGPTRFDSGANLPPSLEAQQEQQLREEEAALLSLGGVGRALASPLGVPEDEQEFEQRTGVKATKTESVTFEFTAPADMAFAPNPGTAAYEVSTRTWASIFENSPERAKKLMDIGMGAMGRGFERVEAEVANMYENDPARKAELEKMTPEKRRERVALESLDIITSMQIAGAWHTPLYVSFNQMMGKEEPEGFFAALAPRVEVLGRSGDEIIYRSETGSMQIFSAIDSIPIIGQSYNIGVLQNYLAPILGTRVDELTALYDDPSWQNLSALGVGSAKMSLSMTGPGLAYSLFSGELSEMHRAGVRGVASRANFAEFTMDVTADLTDWTVGTDLGVSALRAVAGDSPQDLIQAQDTARVVGRFSGILPGMFLAVVHPDALGGTVSAFRGVKAGGRTFLALPDVEKALSPAILGGTNLRNVKRILSGEGMNGRQLLYAAGDKRMELTVAIANDLEDLGALVSAEDQVDAGRLKNILQRVLANEAALTELDDLDASRRVASGVLMDALDKETSASIGAAAEAGSTAAAVLLDNKRAARVGALVENLADTLVNSSDSAVAAKAQELRDLIGRDDVSAAVLTLEPGAARKATESETIASEVFSTGSRLKALRLAVELFDDIEDSFVVRRAAFDAGITAPSQKFGRGAVGELNLSLPEGVTELNSLNAPRVFGALGEDELKASPRFKALTDAEKTKVLESRAKLASLVEKLEGAAESTDFSASLLNPDVREALRLEVIASGLVDGDAYSPLIFRNRGQNKGNRFNLAVNELTGQAEKVSGSSTLQQDLFFGIAGVLSYNLNRGSATKSIARELVDAARLGVADDAGEAAVRAAKDSFLEKSASASRGKRLVNAALAGTREGLLNLVGTTPMMGRDILALSGQSAATIERVTGASSAAVRRAKMSQMTMDGADPGSVANAVQRELLVRLDARRAAILDSLDEGADPAQSVVDINADITRVSADEWRAEFVGWMHRANKQRAAGEEVTPFTDMPIGLDMDIFAGGTRKYKVTQATKDFAESSGFLKAYGFAGEETRSALSLGQTRRTRKKKLTGKEKDAALSILDQMVRFMAKVDANDATEVVNLKMSTWYKEHITGIRRTTNQATYNKTLRNLDSMFYEVLNQKTEELLGRPIGDFLADALADPAKVKVPEAEDLVRGRVAMLVGADGAPPADDFVFEIFDVLDDGRVAVRRFGDASADPIEVSPAELRVLTGDAAAQVNEAIFRAQMVALDSLLPVMTEREVKALELGSREAIREQLRLMREGRTPTMRTAQFLDQNLRKAKEGSGAWVAARAEMLSPEEAAAKLKTFAGDIALAAAADTYSDAGNPAYLDAVLDYLRERRDMLLQGNVTKRELVKSWLITAASQRASEQDVAKVVASYAAQGIDLRNSKGGIDFDAAFVADGKIRPEEAAAAWLLTPQGQKFLDDYDQGVFAADEYEQMLRARKGAHGIPSILQSAGSVGSPKNYGLQNVEGVEDVLAKINAAGGDPAALNDQFQRLQVIADGKVGFVKHFLGLGDTPTVDARALEFWLGKQLTPEGLRALGFETKQADAKQAFMSAGRVSSILRDRILERMQELRALGVGTDLEPEVAAHILHHWIWDAVGDTPVTHEGLYSAMRLAQMPDGVQSASAAGARGVDEVAEAARLYDEMGTESPYFKRWSGGLRVVESVDEAPADGRGVYRVYHGTNTSFDTFDTTSGRRMKMPGASEKRRFRSDAARVSIFATDSPYVAGTYTYDSGSLMPLFMRLDKPLVVDAEGRPWNRLYVPEMSLSELADSVKAPSRFTDEMVDERKARVNRRMDRALSRATAAGRSTEKIEAKRISDLRHVDTLAEVTNSVPRIDDLADDLATAPTKVKVAVAEVTGAFAPGRDLAETPWLVKLMDAAGVDADTWRDTGIITHQAPVIERLVRGDHPEAVDALVKAAAQTSGAETTRTVADFALSNGYDGVIVKNVIDNATGGGPGSARGVAANVVIAFDPNQVKSVNNRGTFDDSARLLFQRDEATPQGWGIVDAGVTDPSLVNAKAKRNRLLFGVDADVDVAAPSAQKVSQGAINMEKTETDPVLRQIFTVVSRESGDTGMDVVSRKEFQRFLTERGISAEQADGAAAVFLHPKNPRIIFQEDRILPDIVAHEMLHAATTLKLEREFDGATELSKEFVALSQAVISQASKSSENRVRQIGKTMSELSDRSAAGELIAYGLSDTAFRDFLRQASGTGVGRKNLYEKFIDGVRKVLGLNDDETSALSELLARVDDLLMKYSSEGDVSFTEYLAPQNARTLFQRDEAPKAAPTAARVADGAGETVDPDVAKQASKTLEKQRQSLTPAPEPTAVDDVLTEDFSDPVLAGIVAQAARRVDIQTGDKTAYGLAKKYENYSEEALVEEVARRRQAGVELTLPADENLSDRVRYASALVAHDMRPLDELVSGAAPVKPTYAEMSLAELKAEAKKRNQTRKKPEYILLSGGADKLTEALKKDDVAQALARGESAEDSLFVPAKLPETFSFGRGFRPSVAVEGRREVRTSSPLIPEDIVSSEVTRASIVREAKPEPRIVPLTPKALEKSYLEWVKKSKALDESEAQLEIDDIVAKMKPMSRDKAIIELMDEARVGSTERGAIATGLSGDLKAVKSEIERLRQVEGDVDIAAVNELLRQQRALEKDIKLLETTKSVQDYRFTHSEVDGKFFSSAEEALADINKRMSTPRIGSKLKFDDVAPHLDSDDMRVVESILDHLKTANSTTIEKVRLVDSVKDAAKGMTDERFAEIYGMLGRVGVLRTPRRGKTQRLAVRPSAQVQRAIEEFFDPKARQERVLRSIGLFDRVNKLDLDVLMRPDRIVEEDVRQFLEELKSSDPEDYARLIEERRDDVVDELSSLTTHINQLEQGLRRMRSRPLQRPQAKELREAAIARADQRLEQLTETREAMRAMLRESEPELVPELASAAAAAQARRGQTFDPMSVDGAPPPPARGAYGADIPEEPDMPKGMVYFFNDTSAILYAFRQADISTGLHEMAHVLRRQLDNADMELVTRWVNGQLESEGLSPIGLAAGPGGRIDFNFPENPESVIMAEELFARAFERYIREGETPNALLRNAFATMKTVMFRIYSTLTGRNIEVDISNEMYDLFDRVFGAKRQIDFSDLMNGPQDFLDMQDQIRRGGKRRLTARIAEQEQVEDTFTESYRQTAASLGDYRFRLMGLGEKDGKTKGSIGSLTGDKALQLGPISRRMLTLEEVSAAREAGRLPAQYQFADLAAVSAASLAQGMAYVALLGGDAARTLRMIPPALRSTVVGYGRELEEFSSEMSMRFIDIARMPPAQRATGMRDFIKYARGEQVRMQTGAQRGQRSRANLVNAEEHFVRMVTAFFEKLSPEARKAVEADASQVLDNRSQTLGALSGFWRGYGKKQVGDAPFESGLPLSDDLDALLALNRSGEIASVGLSQIQEEMFGTLYHAISGTEGNIPSGAISREAERLAAEMAFLSGAAEVKKGDAVFTVADLDNERTFFDYLFFGGEITNAEGKTLTLKGITGITKNTPTRASGTLGIAAQAGYVSGLYDDMRKVGFGLTASDYRVFGKYLNGYGASLSTDELVRAKEIFRRFGRTKFEPTPDALGNFYVPRETRTIIVDQQKQALRQMGLQTGKSGLGWSPLSWMLSTYQSMIIFGGVFQRQAFKFMSTIDLGLQVGLKVGGREGAAAASRAAALTLLSAVGGERLAEGAEALTQAAYAISGKGVPPEMFKAKLRDLAVGNVDEVVNMVTELMGVSKFRVEVNPILENSADAVYVIGGRVYTARSLRKAFTQSGMYSNAFKELRQDFWRNTPTADLEERPLSDANRRFFDSAKQSVKEFFETPVQSSYAAGRRAMSTVFEHGVESADAWSDLERTGAAVTLMEFGYSPRDAAKLVVDSVYDYRGSMTQADRNWARRLLMPFWAFRKNANMQAMNLMASPQGAFRIMALRRALEFGPDALTEVIYEGLLQPYDVDVSVMTPRVRDVYYQTRMTMEMGFGDDPGADVLAEYRANLPEGSEGISDEELLDFSFDGWTIRYGFKGYANVPDRFKIAFRALLSGNASNMVRQTTGVYRLSDALAQRKVTDFYVQEGAKMSARAARGEGGLPAWAAKRPTVQVPIPVLNESAREVIDYLRKNGGSRDSPGDPGDSLYFVFPDNFIMSAVDHAGAILATTVVLGQTMKKAVGYDTAEGEEPTPVGIGDVNRLLNAITPIVDIRGGGSAQLELLEAMRGFVFSPEDQGSRMKVRLHPIVARLIEDSAGHSLPHDGEKPLNPPGSAYFWRVAQPVARAAGLTTGDVSAGPSGKSGRFPRMNARPVRVVARDDEGRTREDPGFDMSTAKRSVETAVPLVSGTAFDYTVKGSGPEGQERMAYTPYLYGTSTVWFPLTFLGQFNKWLLTNVGDGPIEASMLQNGDVENEILNLAAEFYKVIGGRVTEADYGKTASIERVR